MSSNLIKTEKDIFEFIKSKVKDFTNDYQLYTRERKAINYRTKELQIVLKIKKDANNEDLFNIFLKNSDNKKQILSSNYILENVTEKEIFVFKCELSV